MALLWKWACGKQLSGQMGARNLQPGLPECLSTADQIMGECFLRLFAVSSGASGNSPSSGSSAGSACATATAGLMAAFCFSSLAASAANALQQQSTMCEAAAMQPLICEDTAMLQVQCRHLFQQSSCLCCKCSELCMAKSAFNT